MSFVARKQKTKSCLKRLQTFEKSEKQSRTAKQTRSATRASASSVGNTNSKKQDRGSMSSSKAEKVQSEIKEIMKNLHGSSANRETAEFSHDVPSHTSIRIPSERREFFRRKRKYKD